jgi:hypothetical protein
LSAHPVGRQTTAACEQSARHRGRSGEHSRDWAAASASYFTRELTLIDAFEHEHPVQGSPTKTGVQSASTAHVVE